MRAGISSLMAIKEDIKLTKLAKCAGCGANSYGKGVCFEKR